MRLLLDSPAVSFFLLGANGTNDINVGDLSILWNGRFADRVKSSCALDSFIGRTLCSDAVGEEAS